MYVYFYIKINECTIQPKSLFPTSNCVFIDFKKILKILSLKPNIFPQKYLSKWNAIILDKKSVLITFFFGHNLFLYERAAIAP